MSLRPDPIAAQVRDVPGAFPTTPSDVDLTQTSTPQSLSQAVFARRAEYTRSQKIKVKVGTWNVASTSGTEKDIAGWFVDGKGVTESMARLIVAEDGGESVVTPANEIESVRAQEKRRTKKESTIPKNDPAVLPGGEDVGLYVLGLQEVVDVASASEALRPYSDPGPAKKWKNAVQEGLPPGYQLVSEQQLIGLLLLVYASPAIAPTIGSVSSTSVGTGLMGYMGNKGAVSTRIVLGDTTRMVFVNSHLAAGAEKGSLERRNWDAAQIVSRTRFEPSTNSVGVTQDYGDGIGDEDFAFWFGDLNYRLDSLPGEDVRRLLTLHTRNEYDVKHSEEKLQEDLAKPKATFAGRDKDIADMYSVDSKESEAAIQNRSKRDGPSQVVMPANSDEDPTMDPASLQTTLDSLLPHDQLHQQMRSRKAFYDGWREGQIAFLPTYKYDVGSVGTFDSSEKKRGPSWCDRILFRTRRDRVEYQEKVKEEEAAKRKDEEMRQRGLDQDAAAEDVLFDYDPETDGAEESGSYDETADPSVDPDLVFTKDGYEDGLHLDHYASHQRVLSSDHKPLDATFTLTYEAIIPELKAKVHAEVVRQLDKAENEGRPGITIAVDRHVADDDETHTTTDEDPAKFEGVDFGTVRYAHSKTRSFTIANTGRVEATFGFVDRPIEEGDKRGVSPPWVELRVDRESANANANPKALRDYTLSPGETLNVQLLTKFDNMKLVRKLNYSEGHLDDVLVLRVHHGRDHFIPLRGEWLPTSFGRTLDALTHIPAAGARSLKAAKDSRHTEDKSVKSSAPRELFRLTEAIEELAERSVAEWDMTHENEQPPWESYKGWPFATESWTLQNPGERARLTYLVREALDTNQSFNAAMPAPTPALHRLEALAETLLGFLFSLEDGVIPAQMTAKLDADVTATEKAKKPLSADDAQTVLLELLSTLPAHSVSFTFIIFMLSRIASEIAPVRSDNKSTEEVTSPKTRRGRSRTLSHDPAVARRQMVDQAYADIFAGAIFRTAEGLREKEKRGTMERSKEVLEGCLRSKWSVGA